MILYNLDYYPYYIPEQYLHTNNKKDEENSDTNNEVNSKSNIESNSEVNKINTDAKFIKKYYKITKNCIIGGTIGFYLGIVSNNIVCFSLIGGTLGYLYSCLQTIKRN